MKPAWKLLLAAWVIATISTAGALFIGEVMLMTPCTLCWYQRIAMFPMVLILGMACYSNHRAGAVYALPFACIGLVFAGYHTLLLAGWVPSAWVPCSAGVSCAKQSLELFGGVQIPWLSFAAFGLITVLLFLYLKKTSLCNPKN